MHNGQGTDLTQPVMNAPYINTLDQIDHASVLAVRAARIRRLRGYIDRLWPKGHPTRFVHVSGTNGKGSVCRFLEAGFSLAGTAGSYTGPHLYDYRDRFSVNGRAVTAPEITLAWEEVVWPLCVEIAETNPEHIPDYAMCGILLALVLFDRRGVQWAAMETGCGGRYDGRMALDVDATVLTNVGDDHPGTLGDTRWQRAIEKAGSARKDVPMFIGDIDGEEGEAARQICAHIGAPVHAVGSRKAQALKAELAAAYPQGLTADSMLHSDHQLANAALAMSVIARLAPHIRRPDVLEKLANLTYEGRFQQIESGVYIDVAHNPNKVAALMTDVRTRLGNARVAYVLGMSESRNAAALFGDLAASAVHLVVTEGSFKATPAEEVAAILRSLNPKIPVEVMADPRAAVARAKEVRHHGGADAVVVTGSTYMLDAAFNPDPYMRKINSSYGWRFDRPAA
jgi:dihydrofolate synthase/folylpolyglutamate synthase